MKFFIVLGMFVLLSCNNDSVDVVDKNGFKMIYTEITESDAREIKGILENNSITFKETKMSNDRFGIRIPKDKVELYRKTLGDKFKK